MCNLLKVWKRERNDHSLTSKKAETKLRAVNNGFENACTHVYSQLISDKNQKQYSGAETVFSKNGARTPGHQHAKTTTTTTNLIQT